MKSHKIITAGLVSISAILSATAFAADMKPCPAGCFCPHDGKTSRVADCVAMTSKATNFSCNGAKTVDGYFSGASSKSSMNCDKWVSGSKAIFIDKEYGIYSISNDPKTDGSFSYLSYNTVQDTGAIFRCPKDYPNSESGAWDVYDCYKTVKGQKVYYNPTGNTRISGTTARVQIALDGGSLSGDEAKLWHHHGNGVYTRKYEKNIVLPKTMTKSGKNFVSWCVQSHLADPSQALRCPENIQSVVFGATYIAQWADAKKQDLKGNDKAKMVETQAPTASGKNKMTATKPVDTTKVKQAGSSTQLKQGIQPVNQNSKILQLLK